MEPSNLGRLFFKIDNLLLSWAASQSSHPFSLTTFFALDHLACHGPTSMKTLASALDITPASLTALSGKLEQAGWIERRPNPHDGRSALLAITPAGSNTLDSSYQTMQSFFNQRLEMQDQHKLAALFQQIIGIEK